jgi:hypothetical protein
MSLVAGRERNPRTPNPKNEEASKISSQSGCVLRNSIIWIMQQGVDTVRKLGGTQLIWVREVGNNSFQASQNEFDRSWSVFDHALDVDPRGIQL